MKDRLLNFAPLALVLAVVGTVIYLGNKFEPATDSDLARTSVMITRMDGRSGGTGVVLSSTKTESKILTNAHVCGVVKHGGLVTGDSVRGMVASYQVSAFHDLCLITTKNDFGVNTPVAGYTPTLYSDAIASGHPSLLPNIITRGHFSHKEAVTVMTGFRKCEEKEFEGDNAILCVFLGGIPILRTYEAQVISATIMPGSSGSAVFNKYGEISGLVFAGSGNLSYGLIVPLEYVHYFVTTEVNKIEPTLPATATELSLNENAMKAKLRQACLKLALGDSEYQPFALYCGSANDLIFEQ
jgi:hypothetical protein